MVVPDLQLTFFNHTKKDALEATKTIGIIASQWYSLGLLTFDISKKTEISEPEFLELQFIAQLKSSVKKKDLFDFLLSCLKKPYSYHYNAIYFDVFSSNWKYIPIKKDISDFTAEEVIDAELEDLRNDDDKSTRINELRDYLDVL